MSPSKNEAVDEVSERAWSKEEAALVVVRADHNRERRRENPVIGWAHRPARVCVSNGCFSPPLLLLLRVFGFTGR
jgi:hypothetical protein